jgi:hypothetical protein
MAGHRCRRARHLLGHPVRPAHLAAGGRDGGRDRVALGASLGTAGRPSHGGRTEALIMRIIDLQLSFPAILLALVLAACSDRASGS